MTPDDAAQDCERERHERPHGKHQEDGREGEGRGRSIHDCDGVQETPDHEAGACKHHGCDKNVPRPLLATELLVEARAGVPADGRGHQVRDDGRRGNGPALIVHPDAPHEHDHHDHAEELQPGADRGAEEHAVLGRAKDVGVQQLPACLLLHCVELLIGNLQVPREVRSHDSDDDQQEERQDQEHEDKGVDDGEPVDVHVVVAVRHRGLELQLQCLRDGDLGQAGPGHGVGEGDGHPFVPLRDIHEVLQVELSGDVRGDEVHVVVAHDEVQVVDKEIPVRSLPCAVHVHGGLHTEGAIDREVANKELEHVVGVDGVLELLKLLLREALVTHDRARHCSLEVHIVKRIHEAVPPENLPERHEVRHDNRWLAEGQVIILVRLRGVRKRPHLVHAHLKLLVELKDTLHTASQEQE
mmetsp:Transcript_9365/g.21294  ORF Transcript_9365/g.21294 Transcript_9365/m.21294 type:complete len:412 (+) Transcript_9365:707-1942(+)